MRLRQMWFNGLGRVCYRRIYLLERALACGSAVQSQDEAWAFAWLERGDRDEYIRVHTEREGALVDDRIAKGHRCLTARHQGRLVGVMWAATENASIAYLGRAVPFAPGDVYLFDAFTIPEYRGRGIAPSLSAELLYQFAEDGYQRAIRGTIPENTAALRAHAKAGFHAYAVMGFLKAGPWRWDFVRPLPTASATTTGHGDADVVRPTP